MRFRSVICLMILIAAGIPALYGQAAGTISGTVYDPSGAVVADAAVTATNEGTSRGRTAKADEAGRFVFPLLPPGTYTVRVEAEGFNPFVQNEVALQANTDVQVVARLEVQTAVEQVTVSSAPSLLQTNSSTLVQVVEERRIVDLPLNGRNVLDLLSLNAGVIDRGTGGYIRGAILGRDTYQNTVSINGSRGNETNYLLDDVDHNNGHTNIAKPFPNPDAVQEFSLQTSSFDAQYGKGVGGVVNVVTKSGTNEFHGTAFNFLRNFQLNAANFFSGRDTLKRNQFGGTIGGPVKRDRTFFFASYQGTRTRSSTPGAVRVTPSAAMKEGDFSEWLRADGSGRIRDPFDPAGATYFPNNVIPASRIDLVSSKLLPFMPASSDPRFRARFATPTQIIDDDQIMLRGDHNFSDRQRLSVRYFLLNFDRPAQGLADNWYITSGGQKGASYNISTNHNYTFSPRWLNSFSFALSSTAPTNTTPSEIDTSLESLGARVDNADVSMLRIQPRSGWSSIVLGNISEIDQTTTQFSNTVSYATGKHNLRFGGQWRYYRFHFISYFLTEGQPRFTGQFSRDPGGQHAGHAFAEFMLGAVGTWRQLSASDLNVRNNFLAFFVQDDYRVTNKLTLNFGLRYDPKFDFREVNNKRTTFEAGKQSRAFPNAPLGLLFHGDEGIQDSLIPADLNNWAPRVGLAYKFFSTSVFRAAYGIFYNEYTSIQNNRTVQGQPWVADESLVGPLRLSDPYGGGPLLNPEGFLPESSFEFAPFGTFTVPTRDIRAGYMQNWNALVEHQLASDLMFRIGYVGSKGTHLLNAMDVNPGLWAPNARPGNVNQRRPFANIGSLNLGMSNADSTYHSLQLTVRKRYADSFSLLANYTFSKSIDNTSRSSIEGHTAGPDPFNLRNNRGPSDFDLPHRFVLSGIWEMPHLKNAYPALRAILGGWQSNGIVTVSSGTPLTALSGADNNFDGVGGDFADFLGGDWKLDGGRPRREKVERWFNTAVFDESTIGTIGSARRGQLRGPGLWNVNYSLFKNIPIREGLRLQIRGEFFNFFNHANLGSPNMTATSPNFGVINSAGAPRIIQLGAKLIF